MLHLPHPIDGTEQDDLQILTDAMKDLRTLHARPTPHATDEDEVAENMLQRLGENTRNCLVSCLATVQSLIEGPTPFPIGENDWPTTRLKIIEPVYAEYLHDLILTTPGYKIHGKEFGRYLVNKYIRNLASQDAFPEELRHLGLLFFDVNDLKALIDCTSNMNGTRYLQTIAQILVSDKGKTRQWLEQRGIIGTPMAAGGDEFIVLLRSQAPVSQQLLDEAVRAFQGEISVAPELNFQDPDVRKKFDIHDLPERFTPTMAGGGAILSEAVVLAARKGALSPENPGNTFDTSRLAVFECLVSLAESREREDKRCFKADREHADPRWHVWSTRNKENRLLAAQNIELRTENETLKSSLEELRSRLDALLSPPSSSEDDVTRTASLQ